MLLRRVVHNGCFRCYSMELPPRQTYHYSLQSPQPNPPRGHGGVFIHIGFFFSQDNFDPVSKIEIFPN